MMDTKEKEKLSIRTLFRCQPFRPHADEQTNCNDKDKSQTSLTLESPDAECVRGPAPAWRDSGGATEEGTAAGG